MFLFDREEGSLECFYLLEKKAALNVFRIGKKAALNVFSYGLWQP